VAAYFADTSFWMALSRKRDQSNRHAVAWNQFRDPDQEQHRDD
jgi:predicted nucleic acid-binding protein